MSEGIEAREAETELRRMTPEGEEMRLNLLRPAKGAKKKIKRVGRGTGSGHGKTSCRGSKGQNARSGAKTRPGFEGGQMPLSRRLPKRGFRNIFRVEFQIVNVGQLQVFEAGSQVGPDGLRERRLVRRRQDPVKILGGGEINRPLTIQAHAVSGAARSKIEAAGGRIELITS